MSKETLIIYFDTAENLTHNFQMVHKLVLILETSPFHKDDSVTALAVDWVTSNLYWSSSERPDLHVTSRHDGYTTSLLQGSLKVNKASALLLPFCSFLLIHHLLYRQRLHGYKP